MRRMLLWLGLLLAGAAGAVPQALAQRQVTAEGETAEFKQLWDRLRQTQTPAERIALAKNALALEPRLRQWTMSITRARARAELHWELGVAYYEWLGGDRADNLEHAIEAYRQALSILTPKEAAQDWATVQQELGTTYWYRVRGDRADNIENAIAAYEGALTVRTRETAPQGWAQTLYDLGTVYRRRIRGEPADNLDKAIAAYEKALTSDTREAQPNQWADTQFNLGNAYRDRTRGDKADNLEKALAAYEKALAATPRATRPQEWAETQYNLGNLYHVRIRGERADNMERAIAAYEKALTARTRQAQPRQWSDTQANLGDAYRARIRGEPADNLEKAIAAYEKALTATQRETRPREWAVTQRSLGRAYQNRMRGEHVDNSEKAIAALEAALTATVRESDPRDWGDVQFELGLAYTTRALGDRAGNLEKAISAFERALAVRAPDTQPNEWANTLNALGLTYANRIHGDRSDNMEKAIAAFERALTVFKRDSLSSEWAITQSGLGLAYATRVRGDQSDNREKAIAALEAALAMTTREALPREWATMQGVLGLTYHGRIRGDRAENMEKALSALGQALTVFKRETLPREWAQTLFTLGGVYSARIRGDRTRNIENSIAAFRNALTVTTRAAQPLEWALMQGGLGLAYGALIGISPIGGDLADYREKAIAALEAALTVLTRESHPYDWARAQSALGMAYHNRILGDRANSLEKAVAAFRAALTVQRREASPHDRFNTARFLGIALLAMGRWPEANAAFADARDTFQVLLGQGLNEVEARDLVDSALAGGKGGALFAESAWVAAKLGETEEALSRAIEGRARLMAIALKLQTLDLPPDKRKRVDELRAEIRGADRSLEAMQGLDRAAALEKVVNLRHELQGLVGAAADAGSGGVSALVQARALAGEGGAVVVPIVTIFGGKILIVTAGVGRGAGPAGLTVLDLPELTTQKLDVLARGDRKDGKVGGWLGAHAIWGLEDAELSRRWGQWLSAIDGLGPDLWRLFGAKLDAALKAAGVRPGARVAWLPTGALGILPLGLAHDPDTGRRLADDYEVVYALSLEALVSAQKELDKRSKGTPATLAAVVNPTGDLRDAEKEGKVVASHFPETARMVLEREKASLEAVRAALKGKTHWHFASHGTFSWKDARESGLSMAGPRVLSFHRLRYIGALKQPRLAIRPQILSVGMLLDTYGLGRPRLVVLSACETGLYDIESSPDEFIGLPGTFTALGAAGVLGTLWPVEDDATAILMAKFYELHLGQGLAPPAALWQAQLWIRKATDADVKVYVRSAARQGRLETRHVAEIDEALSEKGLQRSRNGALIKRIAPSHAPQGADKAGKEDSGGATGTYLPYAHPYFWAGFIYTGL